MPHQVCRAVLACAEAAALLDKSGSVVLFLTQRKRQLNTLALSREVEGDGPVKPGNQRYCARCQFRREYPRDKGNGASRVPPCLVRGA